MNEIDYSTHSSHLISGGCLLVDRYWYQCDKKDHQNDRATNIYGRALYGDIVLADVYYVDEDENGNELDE